MSRVERPLAERHRKALLRLHRKKATALDGALADQLSRRGLVLKHEWHERREWNRVVARLREVTLTALGREVAAALAAAEEEP